MGEAHDTVSNPNTITRMSREGGMYGTQCECMNEIMRDRNGICICVCIQKGPVYQKNTRAVFYQPLI